MTYFHARGVHYHWRGLVSRSCSGWEGVGPKRYGRQTVTCAVCGFANVKGEEGVFGCVIGFFCEFACLLLAGFARL